MLHVCNPHSVTLCAFYIFHASRSRIVQVLCLFLTYFSRQEGYELANFPWAVSVFQVELKLVSKPNCESLTSMCPSLADFISRNVTSVLVVTV